MMVPGVTPSDPADRGDPDEHLVAALARGDVAAALSRLLEARLLVPVVASGTADVDAEMSVPALVDPRGMRALPAFTSVASLAGWRADARPVPMPGARVILGAVGEKYDGVVVDVAGPHPLQIAGPLLTRLHEAATAFASGAATSALFVE